MKYCLILIDDITRSGGTERVASFLANQLVQAGYAVTLVSLTAEQGEPYYPLLSAVSYRVLGSPSPWVVARFLRTHPSDVLIPISMGRLSFKIASLHAVLRLKSRLILSEHVAFETSAWWVRALKWLSYQLADDLVLLTDHDYRLLQSRVRSRVHVIRNASSFPLVAQTQLADKAKVVLAVGRLTYQKAFERLIRIWASLPERDGWTLRIVGDGEARGELQGLITSLGIADSVFLIPASKAIAEEYQRASLLAMTSRYEGLPLVLVEAKSFGLPAVAFDCKTGPREIIRDGVDGILVADGDEVAFASQLAALMHDDALRIQFQHAALAHAEAFTIDRISQQWQELIS